MPGPPTTTPHGYRALTEKEKQTLRLLLDGHDAKSMARQLDLSVHTINERLRDARRKLAVSSSREAARLLRQAETPEMLGDRPFGAADPAPISQHPVEPGRAPPPRRPAIRVIGGLAMIAVVATILALTLPDASPPPAQAPTTTAPATASLVVQAARAWLELGDAGKWDEALAATGAAFRSANTPAVWRSVSEKVRVPLGPVRSRTLIDAQEVPTPPSGGWVVRFRTDFAGKKNAVETLSLAREDGAWKVVGIYLE